MRLVSGREPLKLLDEISALEAELMTPRDYQVWCK